MTLAEMKTGTRGTITKIKPGGGAIRQRLLDMGVTRGVDFLVERVAPLGDPVEIHIKGYHLAIRKSEAIHIEVTVAAERASGRHPKHPKTA